jgi:hypothetical protein
MLFERRSARSPFFFFFFFLPFSPTEQKSDAMSEVQEAKQFGAWLLAASKSIGKHCDAVNDKFIICKSESNNPAHCVDIGKQVTACALNVYVIFRNFHFW